MLHFGGSFRDRVDEPGPKRLLALDGGGVRGILTLEILAQLEARLRAACGRPDLVLADYFDYIAGTSTGAIVATCLSLAWPVERLLDLYVNGGRSMFRRASLLQRFSNAYDDEELRGILQRQFGAETMFGDDALRTLLLLVMRNATTDSPWPLSNNPRARYNAIDRPDCNLRLPLWQLVRASTAAPVYFPPETVTIGPQTFVFVDGAVTPYNNPAFLLFLMATLNQYALRWAVGAERMLVVSVGTGTAAKPNAALKSSDMNLLYNARELPSALIYASLTSQDMLCRTFGACTFGPPLDRELGALFDETDDPQVAYEPKKFTYVRYDPDLSDAGLRALGLGSISSAEISKLDSVASIDELVAVGRAYAAAAVDLTHLRSFVPSAVVP